MAQFKIAHGQTKNLPTALEEGQVYVTYDNNGQNGKIFADVEIDGETVRVALEGEQGPQGVSGVYVGSGDMPEGYNIQIDPNGDIGDAAIDIHNEDPLAHEDIREEISQLSSEIANVGYVLTAADKEEIASYVQAIYPDAHVIYGDVADDGIITIYGTLPAGEYTLKYEGEDGISTGITTIEVRAKTYTNALPSAVDSDGTPYNGGKGYKTGYRLNSSATETAGEGVCVTGFIPVNPGDVIYLDNIIMNPSYSNGSSIYVYLYKSSFVNNGSYFRADVSLDYALENSGVVLGDNGSIVQMKLDGSFFSNWEDFDNSQTAYLRFSAQEINDNSIISINKPIV